MFATKDLNERKYVALLNNFTFWKWTDLSWPTVSQTWWQKKEKKCLKTIKIENEVHWIQCIKYSITVQFDGDVVNIHVMIQVW